MLSKKLLFRLGMIFLIISTLGIIFYKVDTIAIDIDKKSMQSQMEPLFFFDGAVRHGRLKYELVDPVLQVQDNGLVHFDANVTLSQGLDKAWGRVSFDTKIMYRNKHKAFYLAIPNDEQVVLSVHGKQSNEPDFRLWRKKVDDVVSDMKNKVNIFLSDQEVYEIGGKNLRIQAQNFIIADVQKTERGAHLILNVDQGIFIIITYFVMGVSIFMMLFAYFFIGQVGFKDAENIGYRDLRDTPRYAKKK